MISSTGRYNFISKILFTTAVLIFLASLVLVSACNSMGSLPSDEDMHAFSESPQWNASKKRFENQLKRSDPDFWGVLWKWMTDDTPHARPTQELPVLHRTATELANVHRDLQITWLGHSSMILDIEGHRFLIDPVWGQRASPLSFMGPKRFHVTPLPMGELLKLHIDAVVISHDHYDHLDHETMQSLAKTDWIFLVPLGVGAHLRGWGIASDRITELDWWQSQKIGQITLTAAPARHFSDRSMGDKDKSLWAGWAFVGQQKRAFFSGDSGMFPGFKEIGKRLGPFDLSMMEVGAYNKMWVDVHMGPEQAVEAHQDLRAKVMLPVHWGTFDLAMHAWIAPMERSILAATKAGVAVITPRPGESVEITGASQINRWWPELPFKDATSDPIVSTGLK